MDDHAKPWYARSSFSAAVIGTVTLALTGLRSGWDAVPNEQYIAGVGLWLNFVAFLNLSPSDRPPTTPPSV